MRWFRRHTERDDVDAELEHHFAETVERLKGEGSSESDAGREAARRFGDRRTYTSRLLAIDRGHGRRRRLGAAIDELRVSLRDALRGIRSAPLLSAVAVVSLSISIGANTAVFSIVDAFLLRTLSVERPEELVLFRAIHPVQGSLRRRGEGPGSTDPATGRNSGTPLSPLMFERLRAHRSGLTDVFAFAPLSQVHVLIDGLPEAGISAQYVSGNYYATLGVPPAIGRVIAEHDDDVSSPPVAVISERFRRLRFADESPLGKVIVVNRVPVTIAGVTRSGFEGAMQAGETADISLPLAHHVLIQPDRKDRVQPWYWWLRVMGRLAPGATREQTRAALEPVLQQAAREGWTASGAAGPMPGDINLAVDPGAQGENDTRRQFTASLQVLMGLVGVVLFVACTNLAMLLLARAAQRRQEVAVRLALGVAPARITRQHLVETALLTGPGAVGALAVADWGAALLMAWRPFGATAVVLDLPLNLRVLGFTTAAAAVAMAVVGIAPAWRASRIDPIAALQGGTRALVGDGRSFLSRSLLVVQIALSIVLLVGAGLFIRTIHRLERIDAGFDTRHLAWFRIDAVSAGYSRDRFASLASRVQERLAAIPGVRAATFARVPLLSRTRQNMTFTLPGVELPANVPAVNTNGLAHNFIETMGFRVVAGRAFEDRDTPSAPTVVLINAAFARTYFAAMNPIGRTIQFNSPGFSGAAEIVGVTSDAKYTDLRSETPATVYFSSRQQPDGVVSFAIRTAGEPALILPAIGRALADVDPTLPVLDLRTQEEQIGRLHGQQHLFARLAGFFGVTALVLCAVGLYGLMSQSVARRGKEIGLRMALGAERGAMVTLVLRDSWRLLVVGVVLGLVAASAASRLVASMLFGVTAADPATYLTVSAGLLAVGTIAAVVPASRASRIEPLAALRD